MDRRLESRRPGDTPLSERAPRVVAARRLARRRHRDSGRRFLAEGPQAVTEAVAAKRAQELFVAAQHRQRYARLCGEAAAYGARVWTVTDKALESLTGTVTPQGLVAVCDFLDRSLDQALASAPQLVVVLAEIRDPGNAGTVLRTADAAGAGAVVFTDRSVDPYNDKCVRASAGSLFHLDVVRGGDPHQVLTAVRHAGLQILAADAYGDRDLGDLGRSGALDTPTAWLFGSEAHGLPADLLPYADARVRIPIHGRAESLNLAAAAAVCLYASAGVLFRADAPLHT